MAGAEAAARKRFCFCMEFGIPQVKDELRRDVAVVRLNAGHATLAEIAFELGFADSAAFQRAFNLDPAVDRFVSIARPHDC